MRALAAVGWGRWRGSRRRGPHPDRLCSSPCSPARRSGAGGGGLALAPSVSRTRSLLQDGSIEALRGAGVCPCPPGENHHVRGKSQSLPCGVRGVRGVAEPVRDPRMYRTVREGDASLHYTILPQRDAADVLVDTMTLRHAVKRRGLRSSCCACGPWGLRSRPLLLLGAVLALGCCAVLVAALLPALASASDLEAALQNAFTLGGAGQTASINPNVHHPASRRRDDDEAADRRQHRPLRPARPFSEEDDVEEDAGDDYPSAGQEVAMVSAPELPPLPQSNNAPAVVRALPTEPPFRGPAKARDDQDDDEEDDDDDDLSSESRSIEAAARRMHDVRQSALPPPPNPPGLPPSLLPQRQPPAAPAGLMLDPMMMGDAPMPPRSHRKTNNGMYTNEDDLDHNILDIQPQRAHARASTRIFVEALLPSLPGQGEPEPPQRRSWTPPASFFHWTVRPRHALSSPTTPWACFTKPQIQHFLVAAAA